MELIVGQNTYVTIKEANELVKAYFVEDSETRSRYEDLDNSEKAVYLYRSCLDMQKLPYRGFKKEQGQRLAFPRINKFGYQSDDEMVKLAQVLNAISFMSIDYVSEINQQAYSLLSNGITSFKLGDFSIGFNKDIAMNKFFGGAGMSNSGAVESLLGEWLRGSYRTV